MSRIARRIVGFAAALVGLALVAGVAALALFAYGNSPPPAPAYPFPEVDGITLYPGGGEGGNQAVRLEVRRGESAQSVGNRLALAGLIRDRHFWNLLARFSDRHIRTGSYLIEIPASQLAIRRILEEGRELLLRVTVPEGLTVRETALVMENAGITTAAEFIAAASDPEILARFRIPGPTMEGFLFPDTYMFPAGFPAARIVQTMADNFFAQIAAIDRGMLAVSPEELARLVVLASIVEKEYRVAEEAAIMAGVFQNRLDIGMALQSCATVVYVITEILGRPHPNRIFYVDLEIRSPFNTYMFPGLPPAPIASPGAVALRAAFAPARTDYLFFRLRYEDTGHHTFSRTMDEHSRAAAHFRSRRDG